MRINNKINVCFCIDENYVCQLGAVLGSLVESNQHNNLDIYVLSNQVTEVSKFRLAAVIDDVDTFSITFVESQDKRIQDLEAGGHISTATYIRFEIPSLLKNLDKVLYLDADLVVADDLSEFWQVDVANHFVAAVENPFFDRYESLGMDSKQGYFNAGVLLMNLNLWREEDVKAKAIGFLTTNKSVCLMFDQDALNAVFKGGWVSVDLRWNLQTSFLRGRKRIPELAANIKSAFINPGIVHYSSSSKPWDVLDPHPLTYLYRGFEADFGKYRKKMTIESLVRASVKWLYLKIIYIYQCN